MSHKHFVLDAAQIALASQEQLSGIEHINGAEITETEPVPVELIVRHSVTAPRLRNRGWASQTSRKRAGT